MSARAPIWIEKRDVLTLHERLLSLHGGVLGLRDGGLLQSALARPQQFSDYEATADLIDMAAAYTVGIVKNHPFVDGNKRTGFVVGVLFLELNGYRFTASEIAAIEAVMALAAGEMDQASYTDFLRANLAPE